MLTSSFGAQIMMLALPLTAAVLLHASPTQMGAAHDDGDRCPSCCSRCPRACGWTACASCPSTSPASSRWRCAAASIPLAWWLHALSIRWLYVVAFTIGIVYTSAGSAAQIVLTQVVERDRLVEANAKNALASSGADVAGPGLAGALIKLLGAPIALAVRRRAAAGARPRSCAASASTSSPRRGAERVLARPQGRAALRAAQPAAGGAGQLRRRLADVQQLGARWSTSCSRRARWGCPSRAWA